jgi:hypothetical protein
MTSASSRFQRFFKGKPMFVKPAPGLQLPDPDRQDMLPDEGRDVPNNEFWQRRLRDGDVVAAEAPAAPAHEGA